MHSYKITVKGSFRQKGNATLFFASLFLVISGTIPLQAQITTQKQQITAVSHKIPIGNTNQPLKEEKRIEIPAPRIPIGEKKLIDIKHSTKRSADSTSSNVSLKPPQVNNNQAAVQTATYCPVNSNNNLAPSDIHGAVGKKNLVVVTNSDIGIYDKSDCNRIAYQSLENFFSAVDTDGQELFDPRVLYDFSTNRFFVTAESIGNNKKQYQYVAVSKDGDGTSWWLYRIRLSEDGYNFCKSSDDSFWDYPSAGYNRSKWYITANDSGDTITGSILILEKSDTMEGRNSSVTCIHSLQPNLQPPIVMDSSDSAYFLSPGSGSGDSITRYKLTTEPSITLTRTDPISVSSWSAAPTAKQPNGEGLDTLDGRFQSATIQSGNYLWNVHTVTLDVGSGLRFYKLSTSETAPLSEITMFMDTGDGSYLFNPSTAISPSGEAFITASYTDTNYKPTMVIIEGSASKWSGWGVPYFKTSPSQFENCNDNIGCRWGDYSSIQLDPSNIANAWGFNQLANDTSMFDWTTEAATVSGPPITGFLPAIYYLLGM